MFNWALTTSSEPLWFPNVWNRTCELPNWMHWTFKPIKARHWGHLGRKFYGCKYISDISFLTHPFKDHSHKFFIVYIAVSIYICLGGHLLIKYLSLVFSPLFCLRQQLHILVRNWQLFLIYFAVDLSTSVSSGESTSPMVCITWYRRRLIQLVLQRLIQLVLQICQYRNGEWQ